MTQVYALMLQMRAVGLREVKWLVSHMTSDTPHKGWELGLFIGKGLIVYYYVYSCEGALKNYAPCFMNQSFTKLLRKLVLISHSVQNQLAAQDPPPPGILLPPPCREPRTPATKGMQANAPRWLSAGTPHRKWFSSTRMTSTGTLPSLAWVKLFSVKYC